jgi:hypothetical protein
MERLGELYFMSLELAMRLTELFLAIAFIQQSLEHVFAAEKKLFWIRIFLSVLLLCNFSTTWICVLLFINGIMILNHFQGPYNGGADKITMLTLACLTLAHLAPSLLLQEYAFGYLAMQLIASYFVAGVAKALNPDWWKGKALQDLFAFSIFPAAEKFRDFSTQLLLLRFASVGIIVFELMFPLILISKTFLICGLVLAFVFHLLNVYFFGFNRFVWAWLAAYPSLFWFCEFVHKVVVRA